MLPRNEKKAIILLIIIGTTIGSLFGLAVGYFASDLLFAGSSFETTDDLRKSISSANTDLGTGKNKSKNKDENLDLRAILKPHQSDKIIYTLKPKLDVKFSFVNVKTNSYGMRDVEPALEKPKDTYRIALLGDSFAFGWGVERKESFAYKAEKILSTKLNKRVEILNFGVPGYSTFQQAALHEELGRQFKPDAILIYFIDNDFGLPFFIKNYEYPEKLFEAKEFHKLKDKDKEYNKYRQFLDKMNPNYHIKKLSQECKEKGIPLFVAINPNRKAKRMRDALWILKEDPNVKLLWMRDDFVKTVKEREIDIRDLTLKNDPHPTPLSHGILAEVLSKKLFESLELS